MRRAIGSRKISLAVLGFCLVAAAVGAAAYAFVFPPNDATTAGPLRLVEHGFSLRPNGGSLTYAFVIENRSRKEAVIEAGYRVTFYGASGEIVTERAGTIESVFPRRRAAIAENFVAAPSTQVSRMKVGLIEGKTVPTPTLLEGPGRVGPAPAVETYGPQQAVVRARIENPLDVDLPSVRLVAVVRAPNGRLIGGGSASGQFLLARESKDMEVVLFDRGLFGDGTAEVYALIDGPRLTDLIDQQADFEAKLRERTLAVRWVEASLPEFHGVESMYPLGPERPVRFQMYVAGLEEEPALLLDTTRVVFPQWLDARTVLAWQLSREEAFPSQGLTAISIYDAEAHSESLPLRLLSGVYQSYPSPDGRYVVLNDRYASTREKLLLLARDGTAPSGGPERQRGLRRLVPRRALDGPPNTAVGKPANAACTGVPLRGAGPGWKSADRDAALPLRAVPRLAPGQRRSRLRRGRRPLRS